MTMMEMVVVIGVLAVLTAMLSPTILSMIEDARRAGAESDVKAIASAMLAFNKDTNRWPIWQDGQSTGPDDPTFSALKTDDGEDPLVDNAPGWDLSGAGSLDGQLMTNAPGYPTTGPRKVRSPYLEKLTGDPWGSKYLANVAKLTPGTDFASEAVYVLSCGFNRICETAFNQNVNSTFECGGDDTCFRIK